MRFGSVCSGIEAASVAWHPLGWTAAWLSEIEPFPCAVLKHHYPDVPNLGDMTKFKEWKIESNIDVFVGGTPCQSFSVAGLRKGLDDPRGNLMLTYLAIAKQYRPRWLVWENVPGVLSSADGRDFGSFLGGLAICGYGFAYRVLDAQYFGVAQRRKRVFVVGYLGDWRPAAAVLFERHSLQGNPAPSREKRETVASSIESGFDSSGLQRTVGTLCADTHPGGYSGQDAYTGRLIPQPIAFENSRRDGARLYGDVSNTLQAFAGTGGGNGPMVAAPIVLDRAAFNQGENAQYKFKAEPSETMDSLVARGPHAVLQPIYAIQGSMIGRSDKAGPQGDGVNIEVCFTQNTTDRHAVAYNIAPGKGDLKDDIHVTDAHIAKTIDASGSNPAMHQGGAAIVQPIPFDTTQITSKANYSKPQQGDPCHPLAAGAHPFAVAFGFDAYNQTIQGQVNQPLRVSSAPGQVDAVGGVVQGMAVRRLTPVECERLQGFPDNYTDIKPKGKPTPDGPRYKALGNSMAVPVMAWIGKRIQEVENIK